MAKKNRTQNTEDLLDLAVDQDQLILIETELLLREPLSGDARFREGLLRIEDRTMKSADILRNIQRQIHPADKMDRYSSSFSSL